MADDRAVSPVVGKALEATLVVLYIGLLTTTLYGGVVPEYRTTAGDELADRTLAGAADRIESSIPPRTASGEVHATVELPATIAGDAYRIHAADDVLVLEHPDPGIDGRVPLVLPARVASVSGTWESGTPASIRIVAGDRLEVELA